MKPAVINGQCRLIGHCAQCRTDAAWRASVGTPDACPHGIARESATARGLGDMIASIATPIARALRLPCIDPKTRELKPESGCAKRRDALNKLA